MHVRFTATVQHPPEPVVTSPSTHNPDAIPLSNISSDEDDNDIQPVDPTSKASLVEKRTITTTESSSHSNVTHEDTVKEKRVKTSTNTDAIPLSVDSDEDEPSVATTPSPPPSMMKRFPVTDFIALDKCLPRREFLEVGQCGIKLYCTGQLTCFFR
jgi:hypothetical protein